MKYDRFQSTCPRWGTTDQGVIQNPTTKISIHVPQVGHDKKAEDTAFLFEISIHVPQVGHDFFSPLFAAAAAAFQSTCPRWGTTVCFSCDSSCRIHFNPRAPGGARQ